MKKDYLKLRFILPTLICWMIFGWAEISLAYAPPIGIPDPGMWGSTHPIDSSAPSQPAEWPGAQAANYYYIDNTHPSATDAANTYGYPDKPRMTIPTAYAAGAYVEIHGGPYDGSQLIMTFNCTAQLPCWFRGESSLLKPTIRRETIVKGSYVILENLLYDSGHPVGLRNHNTSSLHHAAVRNSELSRVSISGHAAFPFNNIVIYNNNIHMDNFTNLGPNSPEFPENDTHGVAAGSYSENIWVLDNDIHDVAGDAVGNAHRAEYTAKNYYVGRNSLHDTGEESVDFKEIENVIISQNRMYNNYGPSSGSGGTGVVVHYGPTFSPRNAWIIFNEIYNCFSSGIQIGGSVTDPVYVIGNVIHDISNPSGTGKGVNSWGGSDIYIIDNTFQDNDTGIYITGNADHTLHMLNNIIADNRNVSGYHLSLDYSDYRNNADIDDNIFYQNGGATRIYWGNVYDVSQLIANTGKCAGCLEVDPGFIDSAGNNFGLLPSSPAINIGSNNTVYDLFFSSFGESIGFDHAGLFRPQGSVWDIGAFEFDEGSGPDTTPPAAPSGLAVS